MTSTLDSETLGSGTQPVTVRSRAPRPIWSDDDVPADRVPERYRLGESFVPKGRYLDAEFQQLEVDRLFTKTWLMACRLEDIPGVGSYYEYLIGGHSILVVRESTDTIRGYFNACRHRGTRLATGRGRVGALICPFHGWRWNLDGSIRLVLDPEEFAPRSDDDLGLQPVQVDTWAGFVFINMDLEAEPLLDYLDPIAGSVRAVPCREHALPVDEERHRCRATGRPCSTGSSRRTTCRARTRSSPAGTSATTTSPR